MRNRRPLVVAILISLFTYAVFATGITMLILLFVVQDKRYGIGFLIALGVWLGLLALRYVLGFGCLCPLCRGPWMAKRNCGMHENARRHFAFHYRTSMMLDALLRRWFICPYCGTSFRMRK